MRRFPQFSKATVCPDVKRPITHNVFGKQIKKPVRPKKLTKRDEKYIIRAPYNICEFPLDPS